MASREIPLVNREYGSRIAVVTEDAEHVTYEDLADRVGRFASSFPNYRCLIALKASNLIDDLVAYLACLATGNPVILLNAETPPETLEAVIDTYRPNFILKSGDLEFVHDIPLQAHKDLAVLLSTSGSTGSPKLVRLSLRNVMSNAEAISSYLCLTEEDTAITMLPLAYSYGLSVVNSHLFSGGKIVLSNNTVISREFWGLVSKYHVSSLSGVPYTYQLLRRMGYDRFDTSSIRYLTQAGGKLDEESIEYFASKASDRGQKLYIMYGQTEATARIAYLPCEDVMNKLGSIGIAIPNGKLHLIDDQGAQIHQPNSVGQLVYSGPNVMLGYANSSEELKLEDVNAGELLTGDLGYFDEDGYFFITGRLNRFIKLFGLRVSLDEVDKLYHEIGLHGVATGIDDQLCLLVVDENRPSGADKLVELVSDRFKINQNLIKTKCIKEIPINNSGKVDCQKLKGIAFNE